MRLAIALSWVGLVALACGGKMDSEQSSTKGTQPQSAGAAGAGGSGYKPPLTDGCFGKGTQIATATGSVPIEELRVGDLVQGFDLASHAVVEKPVTEVFVHAAQRVGRLQTSLGWLKVTSNHPIYDAARQGFVPAGSLLEQFQALELASRWSIAPSALRGFSPLGAEETVYNLEVADVHTYFAEGLLVHNKPRCGYPGDPPDCPCSDDCGGILVGPGGGGGVSGGGVSGGGVSGGGVGGVSEPVVGGAPSTADAGASGDGGAG